MEVSQKKTVVVFSKTRRGIPKNSKKWKLGKIEIDEARSYKYLGVIRGGGGTFI